MVRILDRDLKLAGIPKRDDRGRTLDMHALRHTFGTLLSKGGVAPRTAQAAMRHSTIDLTMNVYTDPKLLDVHGALDSLPDLPLDQRNRSAMRATGTDASDALAPVLAPNSGVYGASGSFPVKATPRDKQPSIAPSIDVTSDAVRRNNPLTSPVSGCQMSGRQDGY